jgi:putative endonuclease
LGRRGERRAARHLRRQGYRVLERNVRVRPGEVDLICEAPDERTIVFVEVKTRVDDAVPPEMNVTAAKQRKLLTLARLISRQRGWDDRPLRIDVVAVLLPKRGKATIRHHENAVTL